MRELKFRAWHFVSKDPIDITGKHPREMTYFGIEDGLPDKDIVEVMQYTGLKDKNGKEIYEGDILEVDWQDKRYPKHINVASPVKWDKANACWSLGEGGSPENDAKYHMQVIGNIYENPELLK